MKIVKCSKPKGFYKTNLYFNKEENAEKYNNQMNKSFLLKKAEALEMNFSKRIKKKVSHSRPKKRILTKVGKKFVVWEEIQGGVKK